jgi:hypothetical protein
VIQLRVRRFSCAGGACGKKAFVEQVPRADRPLWLGQHGPRPGLPLVKRLANHLHLPGAGAECTAQGWRCGGMRLCAPVRIPGYPRAGVQTWMRPDLFSTTITASAQLSTLATELEGDMRRPGSHLVVRCSFGHEREQRPQLGSTPTRQQRSLRCLHELVSTSNQRAPGRAARGGGGAAYVSRRPGQSTASGRRYWRR